MPKQADCVLLVEYNILWIFKKKKKCRNFKDISSLSYTTSAIACYTNIIVSLTCPYYVLTRYNIYKFIVSADSTTSSSESALGAVLTGTNYLT